MSDDLAKNLAERKYSRDGKPKYKPLPGAWTTPEPYIPEDSLVNAVNVALYLRRPLLLEGEPGCGKTRLAYDVAYKLGFPLHCCYIRSTSRAQDLLYDYDAIGRLYDLEEYRAAGNEPASPPSREKYLILGELGKAIADSGENIPSVVLIDEIDKADLDFPNDLLLELDRLQFQVREVPDPKDPTKKLAYDALQGKERQERRAFLPLVLITSNREKELPKAFLRRCLFHSIEFPSRETLQSILAKRFQQTASPALLETAVTAFLQLRELTKWRKEIGTSELLDWVAILERDEQQEKFTADRLRETPLNQLPYLETLLKTQGDRLTLQKLNERGERDG